MATTTEDREKWAAVESISARVTKLEDGNEHLPTKAAPAGLIAALDRLETNTITALDRFETNVIKKLEEMQSDVSRHIILCGIAVIISQIVTAVMLFIAIKLWC